MIYHAICVKRIIITFLFRNPTFIRRIFYSGSFKLLAL